LPIKISVQICTFNRKELLKRCLQAVFRTDFPASDYEVALVDDGSTDGTAEVVKSLVAPCRLKYLYQDKSGLAAGRNLGIRDCDGEVILFIDDDTIAHPALLQEHWASHERNPRCVVMGRVNHVDNLDKPPSRRLKPADISTSFFWTSNASVRKRYLQEAGLFDEEFTEYGWEDIEMGFRLRAAGLVRKRNPKAIVYHYKTRWTVSDLPRLFRQAQAGGRSAVILLRKRPCLRVRLATGIFRTRLALDYLVRLGEPFCHNRVAEKSRDKVLTGLPLFFARLLVSFQYFEAVRASLSARGDREPA
jgi:glycosyltransferase involved in cell wall biosynthesis